MLPSTGDFSSAIKQPTRSIGVVLAYKSGDRYVFLQKDNIQDLTYNARVDRGLGGVIKKVCDIKAIYNEYTSQLVKGTVINLYYTCGVNGMCKKALLYISRVKVNKITKVITIEAKDYLSYAESTSTLPMLKNTNLLTYERLVFGQLGYDYHIEPNVSNPPLSLAYPVGTKLLDTFEEMAEANQALFDFGFESRFVLQVPFDLPNSFSLPMTDGHITPHDTFRLLVKYFGFQNPVDSIRIESELMGGGFELDDDNMDQYDQVRVNLFFPSTGDQKSLGSVTATIPGNVLDYNVGTIDFGNTMIPQLCVFNDRVDISNYTIGSDSFSFSVNNSGVLAKNIEAEMYGLDISTATLKDTDTDDNIKQVSNMYIQGATVYNTDIFKHPNCTLKSYGNPAYEVGDTISVGVYDVLILEENLVFNGGLRCTLKGVAKDNEVN